VGGRTDNDSLGGGEGRGGDDEGMNGLIDCNAYSLADCWPEFPVRLRRLDILGQNSHLPICIDETRGVQK
jgi:hypothetical protein